MKDSMSRLINAFAILYPCRICRSDFQEEIKKSPPRLDSRKDLALWFCEQHNNVNEKLGKPLFNCNMKRLQLTYGRNSHRSWSEQFSDLD